MHWGGTLQTQWLSEIRTRDPIQQRNSSSDNWPQESYYNMGDTMRFFKDTSPWNKSANHSALYQDNNFRKKTRMLGDMFGHQTRHPHSFTTVIIISSLFLFMTLGVAVAIVVFCRKKNTVFAFQKSEQEDHDADYEMDEINTDVEYTDTDQDTDPDSTQDPSHSEPSSSQPLVRPKHAADDISESPSCHWLNTVQSSRQGKYQKMVVAAVLERRPSHSDTSDDSSEGKSWRYKVVNKRYYGVKPDCNDLDSDLELLTANMVGETHTADDTVIDMEEDWEYSDDDMSTNNNNNNPTTGTAPQPSSHSPRLLARALPTYCDLHQQHNVSCILLLDLPVNTPGSHGNHRCSRHGNCDRTETDSASVPLQTSDPKHRVPQLDSESSSTQHSSLSGRSTLVAARLAGWQSEVVTQCPDTAQHTQTPDSPS